MSEQCRTTEAESLEKNDSDSRFVMNIAQHKRDVTVGQQKNTDYDKCIFHLDVNDGATLLRVLLWETH